MWCYIIRIFYTQSLNWDLIGILLGGVITVLSNPHSVYASDTEITTVGNNTAQNISYAGVTRTTTAISFIATVKNKNGFNSTEDYTSDVITAVPDLTNASTFISSWSTGEDFENINHTISSSISYSKTTMASLTLEPNLTFSSSTIMANTSEPISVTEEDNSNVTMTSSTITIATNQSTMSLSVTQEYNVTEYLTSTTELSTTLEPSSLTTVTSLMMSSSSTTSSSSSSSLTSTDLTSTTTTILPTTTESTTMLQTTPKLTTYISSTTTLESTPVPSSSISSTWESTSGVNGTLPTSTAAPDTPLGIILGVTFGILGVLAIILLLLMLRKYIAGRIRRKKYSQDEENIDDYQVDYKEPTESNKSGTILRPHKKSSSNHHPPVNLSPSATNPHPKPPETKNYFANPTYAGPEIDNLDFLRRNRPSSNSYDDEAIPLSNLNSIKAESRFSMGPVILDDDEPSTQKTYDTMYSTHNTFKK